MADIQAEAIDERPEEVEGCPDLAVSLEQAVEETVDFGVPVKDTTCKNIDPSTTSGIVGEIADEQAVIIDDRPEGVEECPNLAESLELVVEESEDLGVPVKDTTSKNIDPDTTRVVNDEMADASEATVEEVPELNNQTAENNDALNVCALEVNTASSPKDKPISVLVASGDTLGIETEPALSEEVLHDLDTMPGEQTATNQLIAEEFPNLLQELSEDTVDSSLIPELTTTSLLETGSTAIRSEPDNICQLQLDEDTTHLESMLCTEIETGLMSLQKCLKELDERHSERAAIFKRIYEEHSYLLRVVPELSETVDNSLIPETTSTTLSHSEPNLFIKNELTTSPRTHSITNFTNEGSADEFCNSSQEFPVQHETVESSDITSSPSKTISTEAKDEKGTTHVDADFVSIEMRLKELDDLICEQIARYERIDEDIPILLQELSETSVQIAETTETTMSSLLETALSPEADDIGHLPRVDAAQLDRALHEVNSKHTSFGHIADEFDEHIDTNEGTNVLQELPKLGEETVDSSLIPELNTSCLLENIPNPDEFCKNKSDEETAHLETILCGAIETELASVRMCLQELEESVRERDAIYKQTAEKFPYLLREVSEMGRMCEEGTSSNKGSQIPDTTLNNGTSSLLSSAQILGHDLAQMEPTRAVDAASTSYLECMPNTGASTSHRLTSSITIPEAYEISRLASVEDMAQHEERSAPAAVGVMLGESEAAEEQTAPNDQKYAKFEEMLNSFIYSFNEEIMNIHSATIHPMENCSTGTTFARASESGAVEQQPSPDKCPHRTFVRKSRYRCRVINRSRRDKSPDRRTKEERTVRSAETSVQPELRQIKEPSNLLKTDSSFLYRAKIKTTDLESDRNSALASGGANEQPAINKEKPAQCEETPHLSTLEKLDELNAETVNIKAAMSSPLENISSATSSSELASGSGTVQQQPNLQEDEKNADRKRPPRKFVIYRRSRRGGKNKGNRDKSPDKTEEDASATNKDSSVQKEQPIADLSTLEKLAELNEETENISAATSSPLENISSATSSSELASGSGTVQHQPNLQENEKKAARKRPPRKFVIHRRSRRGDRNKDNRDKSPVKTEEDASATNKDSSVQKEQPITNLSTLEKLAELNEETENINAVTFSPLENMSSATSSSELASGSGTVQQQPNLQEDEKKAARKRPPRKFVIHRRSRRGDRNKDNRDKSPDKTEEDASATNKDSSVQKEQPITNVSTLEKLVELNEEPEKTNAATSSPLEKISSATSSSELASGSGTVQQQPNLQQDEKKTVRKRPPRKFVIHRRSRRGGRNKDNRDKSPDKTEEEASATNKDSSVQKEQPTTDSTSSHLAEDDIIGLESDANSALVSEAAAEQRATNDNKSVQFEEIENKSTLEKSSELALTTSTSLENTSTATSIEGDVNSQLALRSGAAHHQPNLQWEKKTSTSFQKRPRRSRRGGRRGRNRGNRGRSPGKQSARNDDSSAQFEEPELIGVLTKINLELEIFVSAPSQKRPPTPEGSRTEEPRQHQSGTCAQLPLLDQFLQALLPPSGESVTFSRAKKSQQFVEEPSQTVVITELRESEQTEEIVELPPQQSDSPVREESHLLSSTNADYALNPDAPAFVPPERRPLITGRFTPEEYCPCGLVPTVLCRRPVQVLGREHNLFADVCGPRRYRILYVHRRLRPVSHFGNICDDNENLAEEMALTNDDRLGQLQQQQSTLNPRAPVYDPRIHVNDRQICENVDQFRQTIPVQQFYQAPQQFFQPNQQFYQPNQQMYQPYQPFYQPDPQFYQPNLHFYQPDQQFYQPAYTQPYNEYVDQQVPSHQEAIEQVGNEDSCQTSDEYSQSEDSPRQVELPNLEAVQELIDNAVEDTLNPKPSKHHRLKKNPRRRYYGASGPRTHNTRSMSSSNVRATRLQLQWKWYKMSQRHQRREMEKEKSNDDEKPNHYGKNNKRKYKRKPDFNWYNH